MQALLCDICEQPIRGEATEHHIIRGEATATDSGKPRIAQRGSSQMLYLCGSCSGWLQSALAQLRSSLAGPALAGPPAVSTATPPRSAG